MDIKPRLTFTLDGVSYMHANPQPDHAVGTVRRFPYREEPHVIAQVPLEGGGTVEVHGYATHYSREWVSVVWNDDEVLHLNCWVAAADVRRPSEGEWHGHWVQF